MPHADKARGQNMQQKALDKSVSLKLRYLQAVALLTVAKGESNLIPLQVEQTVVGNRHTMGIATQITQGLLDGVAFARSFWHVMDSWWLLYINHEK
jgi:hypothetical protein